MLLTVFAYAMMVVFMYVIMKKKMSPFTALVLIPLAFALVAVLTGVVQDVNIGTLVRQGLFGNNSKDKLTAMKGTAETGVMLVARGMVKKERARLGIKELTDAELDELTTISDPEVLAIRRPQNFWINAVMTLVLVGWLVAGSFIDAIEVKPVVLFLIGTGLAMMINYPDLKTQSKRIGENAGDAVQVVLLVFGAGVFMGLFQGTGMAKALTDSIVHIIPQQLAGFWSLIIALISVPGTFFLTNDGFYYGVLIPFAEIGRQYGFTDMQMALASLMGQAFHLLSPLVAFIYLLLRLTGLDMGEWQRESAKYAAVVFVIFVVTIVLMGHMPLYLAQ